MLSESALQVMQIQLDKFEVELATGGSDEVDQRWDFWHECRDLAFPAAHLYWDQLILHGGRLRRLAGR